jgi:hypothetical protein
MSLRPAFNTAKLSINNLRRRSRVGMVSIDDSYMALLRDYSEKTGVPIDRCVSDALFDWLANVAPLTLEQLSLPPLKLRRRKPSVRLRESRKHR